MTETINLICDRCKHVHEDSFGCEAFPEGIPDKVLETNEHFKPLKDQKNKIVFEPKEKK